MRQLFQNFKTGELLLEDLPVPLVRPGGILVATAYSVISAGTERRTVATAQAGLIGKARLRPDLVKQVLDSARREGVKATWDKVRSRLDSLKPLGYSSAGVVLQSGSPEFQPGDHVACGGGYAAHAETVFVPVNLAVKVADTVPLDQAAFATVGAIALQGVRQSQVQLGETVVVIGLGLLGLLSVSLLRSAGCRVVGADIDSANFSTARTLGCDDTVLMDELEERVAAVSQNRGADAVIITASTGSNDPVELAGAVSRQKGRVIIVGAVGMQIPRDPDYYGKELDIRFSCSYGPGRYDPEYEEHGHDYPAGYVRWTENRNMAAFVDLIASGRIDIAPLITHRFALTDAMQAYDLVLGKTREPHLGIVLEYDSAPASPLVTTTVVNLDSTPPGKSTVAFIGAGNFAQSQLIPPVKAHPDASLRTVITSSGITARAAALKFDFVACGTDPTPVWGDAAVDTVFIATRHDLHGELALQALRAGKRVFVEKPLCLKAEELTAIEELYHELQNEGSAPLFTVGYNRRFAPTAVALREFAAEAASPLLISYRVNAGFIPPEHWIQDPAIGGGRIIGEVCHFIDFLGFLTGAPAVSVLAHKLPDNGRYREDNLIVVVNYADGSCGTLLYAANGDKGMPKEQCELFGGGRAARLDDFNRLTLYHNGKKTVKLPGKGHRQEVAAFLNAPAASPPIPVAELFATSRITFAIIESLRTGTLVQLG